MRIYSVYYKNQQIGAEIIETTNVKGRQDEQQRKLTDKGSQNIITYRLVSSPKEEQKQCLNGCPQWDHFCRLKINQ